MTVKPQGATFPTNHELRSLAHAGQSDYHTKYKVDERAGEVIQAVAREVRHQAATTGKMPVRVETTLTPGRDWEIHGASEKEVDRFTRHLEQTVNENLPSNVKRIMIMPGFFEREHWMMFSYSAWYFEASADMKKTR